MKKYLLFQRDFYDTKGGWSDFVMSFKTLDDAKKHIEECEVMEDAADHWEIVDSEAEVVVYRHYLGRSVSP